MALANTVIMVIIVILGLIGLYYLYQYLFSGPGATSVIIKKQQSAKLDPSAPIVVPSAALPPLYSGGEFSVSTWIYVNDWTYRNGYNKAILSIGGPTIDTLRIYLGGQKPVLRVRVNTSQGSSGNKLSNKNSKEGLYTSLQTDSGMLDSTANCDIPNIEFQRWVCITVAINGMTCDVYIDGKLARSCVLSNYFNVDSAYALTVGEAGGFGGNINTTQMYGYALSPDLVYNNYMAGPMPVTNILGYLQSFFQPSVST
jgi:hypothetical protein